jgi:hypothetical protein
MTRWYRSVALGVLLGLVVVACGAPVDEPDDAPEPEDAEEAVPEAPDDADAPDEEPAPPEEVPTDPEETGPEVTVYFVRSHESGIWVEPEVHVLDQPTEAVARGAMEILFAGEPHDAELASAVPDGVAVLATNIRERVLIVDVSAALAAHSTGSAEELAFAQQFAHTGAAFDTVDAVELWVDGAPIEELWGHLDWSEPIEPDPFAVSPIVITDPPAGPGEVTVPAGEVTARGTAMVFEATFFLRLYDADGTLLADDVVTASAGGPERGTWEHTFTITDPGEYRLEAEEDDPSDGEGRAPFLVSRGFTVG